MIVIRPLVSRLWKNVFQAALIVFALTLVSSAFAATPSIALLEPDSATAGGPAFTLSVYGLNLVSGATVTWNGSSRTTQLVNAEELQAQITAADIANAGSASIAVVNPGGATSAAKSFPISPPVPAISGLSPSATSVGSAGFTLSVNGAYFSSGATVEWNGSARTTTYVSSSELQAQITAADVASVGAATVTVMNADGTVTNSSTFTITPPPPTIVSLSPPDAMVAGPAFTLTVNGTNFLSAATVNWNGSPRTTTYVSSTQLTAQITAADIADAENSSVTVVEGEGTSNPVAFIIVNPPLSVASLAPFSTPAGGPAFTLTVNGTNFIPATTVLWNNSALSTTYVSSTQLTAQITSADIAMMGGGVVSVTNNDGVVSNTIDFTITTDTYPTINSLAPLAAIAGGAGFTLTLNGFNFNSGSVVQWNGSPRTTTYVSSSELTAQITSADIANATTANVTVMNTDGTVSGASSFFVSASGPIITSISPNSAPFGGDAQITVYGVGFDSNATVTVGGNSEETTFNSSTQLTAIISGSDLPVFGSVQVSVVDNGVTSNSATYTIPSIFNASFDPSTDTLYVGAEDQLNPEYAFSVSWNGGSLGSVYPESPSSAVFSVPDYLAIVPGPVTISSDLGDATFTLPGEAPQVGGFSNGNVVAGDPNYQSGLVNGNHLEDADVYVNGVYCQSTDDTDIEYFWITLNPYNLVPGPLVIEVVGPGGTGCVTLNVIGLPPVTTLLSPSLVTAGGSSFTLTICGDGFNAASIVQWNGVNLPTSLAGNWNLYATVPASDIASPGVATITVVNPGYGTSAPLTVQIIAAPKTAVTPPKLAPQPPHPPVRP